ncbi:MAG: phage head closure protein [Oscillospiraceae bacterium]|jgi:SPP1 family predicted phage head-tail adaptor|nr:phage head closure protein [Oscillospiraceae bacterium]
MFWRDVGFLIPEKEELDAFRKPQKIPDIKKKRRIFCNKKSIRQSEFYQAHAQGYRPELMFEIRSSEYRGEMYLEYNGKMYRKIRTYDKNGEIMELVVNSMVVNNGR